MSTTKHHRPEQNTKTSAIIEIHPSEAAACKAVNGPTAAGVPERNVRLLIGKPVRDVRNEPIGGFAEPVAVDAPVGTYGDVPRSRWRGAGSFAGDPDRLRQGSFADTDRTAIVRYPGGAERARLTGDAELRGHLHQAGVDDPHADRVLDELHKGRAAVLADVAAADARAILEQVALAA